MDALDRVKGHFDKKLNSRIEVPEWGDENGPLVIYYDPPTLKDNFMLGEKANSNPALVMCYLIVRKAKDKNGERLFKDSAAEFLYDNGDANVISRVALAMKNHVSVEEQVKN